MAVDDRVISALAISDAILIWSGCQYRTNRSCLTNQIL